jgi:diguanylate cyclase (GGDEF)-like protein
MMPGLDGLAVCRAVRQTPGPYVYVILLTSRSKQEDKLIGLDAKADDFLTKPFDLSELGARIKAGARILDLQSSLLATQAALHYEATHDRLTDIWNRGMVLDHLGRELARAQRLGAAMSVVVADIDHFKAVNDNWGHETGDRVLHAVARGMQTVLRRTDGIGRYGGEEFLLVLADAGVEEARFALERVRQAVKSITIDTQTGPVRVTVSFGVVGGVPGPDETAGNLIERADEALYQAKAAGRDCIMAARPDCTAAEVQPSSLMSPRRSAYSTVSV